MKRKKKKRGTNHVGRN